MVMANFSKSAKGESKTFICQNHCGLVVNLDIDYDINVELTGTDGNKLYDTSKSIILDPIGPLNNVIKCSNCGEYMIEVDRVFVDIIKKLNSFGFIIDSISNGKLIVPEVRFGYTRNDDGKPYIDSPYIKIINESCTDGKSYIFHLLFAAISKYSYDKYGIIVGASTDKYTIDIFSFGPPEDDIYDDMEAYLSKSRTNFLEFLNYLVEILEVNSND